jgi:hypothetical protein
MRFDFTPLLLAAAASHASIALAQSATDPAPASAPTSAEVQPEPVAPESAAPSPAQTADSAAHHQAFDHESASEPGPAAATAAAPEASSSAAGWTVIGIGGSIAAANIALGASLLVQGESDTEQVLGSATLTAGLTGLGVSLLVGLLMM